jgi:tight adherence protein C
MAQVNAQITAIFGPAGPLLVLIFLGLVLLAAALGIWLQRPKDPFDKLAATTTQKPAKATQGAQGAKLRAPTTKDKLERYATFLEPQNAAEYGAARLKLIQAGYRSKNAVRIYHFLQFALGLGGLAIGAVYALLENNAAPLSTRDLALMVFIPGAAGYLFPKYWVTRRQQERQKAITNAFPDALDLLLVCVEAGLSLDQSIIRVAQELRAGYPELAEELEIVSNETKAGKDRATVLRDMAERSGVDDIASFVTVIVQSAEFGTAISEALRVYSAEMRDKRIMRAEEAANKLPTKMTLATMMLTVPPLMAILIGPAVYAIAVSFG